MILSKTVTVYPPKNRQWRQRYIDKGYTVTDKGYFEVTVTDLPINSKIRLECSCDLCHSLYFAAWTNIVNKEQQVCRSCQRKQTHQINKESVYSAFNPGRFKCGTDHPRHDPNRDKYLRYRQEVNRLTEYTYRNFREEINPNQFERKRSGESNGYHLDHILSVKSGFNQNIDPVVISDKDNLQMLPWLDNLRKSNRS